MDKSDEAQIQQDILKLQLHTIPLNLDFNNVHEVESEEDEDTEFLPDTQREEDEDYTILDLDQPSTSKAGLQSQEIAIQNEDKNDENYSQDESIASDDEELIDLSEDMPPTPFNLLRLNLAYQEVIKQEIAKVDQLLKENSYQKAMIAEEQARQVERVNKMKIPKIDLGGFNEQFFKDYHGNPPESNPELERRKQETGDYFVSNSLPGLRWKKEMDTALCLAVQQNARREVTEPLLSKLEYLQDQYRATADEQIKKRMNLVRDELHEAEESRAAALVADRFHPWDWATISNLDLDSEQSPERCKLRWINFLHPSLKTGAWSKAEIEKLRVVLRSHADHDWNAISREMDGRTASDCCKVYMLEINPNFKRKAWTPEEDERVVKLVERFRVGDCIPYTQISCHMKNRYNSQIVHRWSKSLNPNYKKVRWTPEEDALLLKAVAKYGTKWSKIRDAGIVPGRNDAQMRERYMNAFRSVRAGPWSVDEDQRMFELIEKYGKNWNVIAKHMKGRSDSQCLKRYDRICQAKERGSKLHYQPKRNFFFFRELQKVREKLASSINAEQVSVKSENPDSIDPSAAEEKQGEMFEIAKSRKQALIPARPLQSKGAPTEIRELFAKVSSSDVASSDDVTKLYRKLIDFRDNLKLKRMSRTSRREITAEEKELQNSTHELIADRLRPMKILSRTAGNPISDHVISLQKKSETISAKTIFVHYLKALNIDAEKALTAIRKRRFKAAPVRPQPQARMNDTVGHQLARKNTALVDMKQLMTGKKSKLSDVANCKVGTKDLTPRDIDKIKIDISTKTDSFIRDLYLPLCAPNYATARAYRSLLKDREVRVGSVKSILLPNEDDVTDSTSASRDNESNSKIDSARADVITTSHSNNTNPGSEFSEQMDDDERLEVTISSVNDPVDVTSASSSDVKQTESQAENEEGSAIVAVEKYDTHQLLNNMRTSYKYKIFRSRFNALFTWPTLLSSLVPYVKSGKDGVLRPVVKVKRSKEPTAEDTPAAKKRKLQ